MTRASSTAGLPECVGSLCWDVDAAALDAERDRDFLVGRILASGTLDAIRWARGRYGDDAIRQWIVRHRGRQLSGRQLRFWETVIGLPEGMVDAWQATPERRIWEGRTAS